ncbi:restriction endonuclease subunit S [Klebsiella pneumoniae]|uniref:restriction endonuclease subunit S n=1 Tax=Klebsiella TaxID=570 RepID=UPI000DEB8022|nr:MULTISPECIES: restriction endonuclease subunit S [Klebsiella]EJO2872603.1 restriction endonuclease subunit S [Klebsiella pneumoniae]MDQ2561983.1 restriction endonuclease subunit S [Klebsiella michiganensis]RBW72879.1 restriction endonuclease subunit S [Klebsiella pneumoniae]HBR1706895.1 restriction endonuclease subunit S [Klebsiella pneumoniae]HBT3542777.1 restriction endonuclease subunit S [Klebsiella pneumoniae]
MSICTEETKIAVIGRYKNFDDYISSGYDYLPKVPTHWRVLRNRQLFQFKKRIVGKFVEKYQVLSLTLNGVIPRDIESGKGKMPAEFDSYQIVKPRNLIFCLFDIDETPRTIGISSHEGMVTGAYKVAEVVKEHSPEFVYYYYLHLDEFKGLKPFYTGLRKVVRPETFLGLCIPVPPLEEQRTIAAFLDFETARIDKLIAQQQRLIELLKEKRQAVISHAVTKGLNPDAPMKDSGVEWLGEVPEHWAFVKLKWIATTTSGSTPNTGEQEKYYADGIYPWVRTTDLNNDILSDIPVKITEQALADTACSLLPPGTVLIAMYGGAGSIGKHALLSVPSTTNQAVCAILPTDSVIPEFLNLFAGFYRPYWMVGAEGTRKDPNIGQDHIKELKLPIPPLLEQKLICAQINQKLSQYSVAEDKAFKFTWLLQERRTALISAAVTGKIDLRGWTAPTEEASNG